MTSPPADEHRHPIESIASEVADSIRGGRRTAIQPIVDANPELESQLRDLLPVIQRLEQARQTQSERPAGLASLGASRPTRLGDFELVRQIGRGGMGVVFEARQQSLGRTVAVKVLPKSLLSDEDQLKRFEREARTAGSLHHTNIVPVFGVGEDQGFHYYVMQRIDGRGLDRVLGDGEQLSPDQVAKLGQQAASALAYAHAQNILHRDIKPANLIVNDENQLWVTDFGVSKAIESEAVTRTGDVVGTLRYMAPEQIVGVTDVRSDIYSLGVTLYELLAGRPAMDDASIREALVARRPAPAPPPLRQLNPDVPHDLETILQTAMATDLNRRYATAAALSEDLANFIDGQPISVRRMSVLEKSARWARRNPAMAALSTLSLLLLVGVAVLSTIGYVQVQSALDREQSMRLETEATAKIASGALDQIFERFSDSPDDDSSSAAQFSSAPPLSSEVADLLEDLLLYYDELAARSESDPKLRRSAASARYSMGDIHFQLGHYQKSIRAFTLSLSDHDSDSARNDSVDRLRRARIHNRIGLAHRMLGQRDQAESEHELALQLLTLGQNAPDDQDPGDDQDPAQELSPSERFELARTHYLFAAQLRPGMGPTAMPPMVAIDPEYRGVTGLGPGFGPDFERNWERPPGPPRSLSQRGPPRLRAGRPRPRPSYPMPSMRPTEDQESHLLTAVGILRSLRQQDTEHIGYAISLAASLRQLAGDSFTDRTAQEDEMESEAIALLRELHQNNPNDSTIRSELAAALAGFNVFEDGWSEPKMETVIERLREATGHCESLSFSHPNVPTYTNRLVHTHFKLGVMLERLAQLDSQGPHQRIQEAGASFREAAQRYKMMIRQYPDAPGYQAWYALFLERQGVSAMRAGLLDQAERALTRSVRGWKWMIEHYPEEQIGWHALPLTYQSLSHVQRRLEKHDEAKESMMEAEMSRLYRDMQP